MVFAPDGGWLLLFEHAYLEQGLPRKLVDEVADHYRNRVPIRCVSFTSQGDWILIDDRNEIFPSKANHPAAKKLAELRRQGETIRWIGFEPGEYTHGYALEHVKVQRIRAVMSLILESREGGVTEWVVLPPQVPELARQHDVKRSFDPATVRVADAGPLKLPVALTRVVNRPSGFTATATYELTLCTNRLVPRLAGQAARQRPPVPRDAPPLHGGNSRHENRDIPGLSQKITASSASKGNRPVRSPDVPSSTSPRTSRISTRTRRTWMS